MINLFRKKLKAENNYIPPYYTALDKSIRSLNSGGIKLLLVGGRGGTGKSHQIKNILGNVKADYVRVNGDLSPAYLYRYLYENMFKIVWFCDVQRLLEDKRSLELLKSATELEEPRIVSNHNYNHTNDDLPKSFEFRGRIILDYNSIPSKNLNDYKALLTRAEHLTINPTVEEMKELFLQVCVNDFEKKVAAELMELLPVTKYHLWNLRTLRKCINLRLRIMREEEWSGELKMFVAGLSSEEEKMIQSIIGEERIKIKELVNRVVSVGLCPNVAKAKTKIGEWLYLGYLTKEDFTDIISKK